MRLLHADHAHGNVISSGGHVLAGGEHVIPCGCDQRDLGYALHRSGTVQIRSNAHHGRTVLRGHVGQRRAAGQAERGEPFAEELDERRHHLVGAKALDSHTPMNNGLGVHGWGVGGIKAGAAMLGQPVTMRLSRVVGCRLKGRLPAGTTAC